MYQKQQQEKMKYDTERRSIVDVPVLNGAMFLSKEYVGSMEALLNLYLWFLR